jgi:WD40 repeat protein
LPAQAPPRQAVATPLVIIPDGRLSPIEVQQVPALRDGQLLFIGTPVKSDEKPPPGREGDYLTIEVSLVLTQRTSPDGIEPDELVTEVQGSTRRYYSPLRKDDPVEPGKVLIRSRQIPLRRLRDGDEVREGQLLALVDPSLAVDDLRIKAAKLEAAEADRVASEKTREEAKERFFSAEKLRAKGGMSQEEYRGALLTWDRYKYETIGKEQQVIVQAKELRQAETVVDLHAIHSKITGQVKNLLKHRGEAVRNLDTVMVLQDNRRLRIEGRVDYPHRRHLKVGDRIAVEPTQSASPSLVLLGHMQEITGVAVSMAGDIVSSSEDRTVRVWNRHAGQERLILPHKAAVRCVACDPVANLCLSGGADGIGRLWNLGGDGATPAVELRDGHRGGINCVTFSKDGRWCATGGEDRAICLWQVADGALLQRFPAELGHRGAVTSVQILPADKEGEQWLVSAGRGDHTLLAWPLASDGTPGTPLNIGRRGGDVNLLGFSADGKEVLFDQGKELRLLSLPSRTLAGVLTSTTGTNFTTLALFSPDRKLILTASGTEGRLQLWRSPTPHTRGYELRQLAWPGDPVTCGAFAPDGTFLVAGTRDRSLLVWTVPSKQEVETQPTAEIVLVENDLDLNSRQVRVHAELDNRRFELTSSALANLKAQHVSETVLQRLAPLVGKEFTSEKNFRDALAGLSIPPDELARFAPVLVSNAEKAGPLLPGNTATMVVYPK